LKISSNAAKVSTPGKKQVWRISANSAKKNEGDWISMADEDPRKFDALFMFHPQYTYINKVVTNYTARPLLQDVFVEGKQVMEEPSVQEIKALAARNLDGLWDEYKRSLNPQEYPVDMSQRLYDHKLNLIHTIRARIREREL
jgi:nicotinate phosphoribosyltransferase